MAEGGGVEGVGVSPPGTLAAPSSVLRVHLTRADLPLRPIAKVGDNWAQGEERGTDPEQLQAVPGSETIVPIIQS